jgi:LmbE family N-acetylglucosaminyl deacetylase
MAVDILAFGAHPDDAEIGCGGLLLRLKDRGYRTGIVYLTVGEMGSRGTPDIRRQELTAAAKVLGLDHVEVLDFQDCRVVDDFASRLRIAAIVRQQRPTLVLAPYWDGPPGRGVGHTDHQTAGYLVSHGVNFATFVSSLWRVNPIAYRIFFTIYILGRCPPPSLWISRITSNSGWRY